MGDEILYHGSREERTELNAHRPGYGGSLGYGLYLTTDPEFAAVFGKYIHTVVSPVPPDLVAVIEPIAHDCGDSMEMGTPGSVPFTFRIVDHKTRKEHVYSVLGNCEEQVKQDLRSELRKQYKPSARLAASVAKATSAVTTACGVMWSAAMAAVTDARSRLYGKDMSDAVEEGLDNSSDEDGLGDKEFKKARSILIRTAKEMDKHMDDGLSKSLGEEIDLSDLSSTCEMHGYSAFYISDYAPGGDEYVIFDDQYLPLAVRSVTKLSR